MRLVLSKDIPDGLHAVKRYTLGEIVASHAALDALDDMKDLERRRMERDRRHRSATKGTRG